MNRLLAIIVLLLLLLLLLLLIDINIFITNFNFSVCLLVELMSCSILFHKLTLYATISMCAVVVVC